MNFRKNLLLVGHLEGISFLILLFIAMPLKYFWNLPEAVRITGSFHGILFVLLIYMLWQAKNEGLMSFKQFIIAILLSFLPAGTFFLHKYVRSENVD